MFSFGGGGFGGFEGMHGHGGGRPKKEVDTTGLYTELGIEKDSSPTQAQIKKAFRKLAMKHHPDKGGDPEKFKRISKAYEILGDQNKKELYDKYGEDGVNEGGPTGGDGMDIFDLFGGGGRRRGGNRKRKGEDVVFPLKVGLADLFKGTVKKLKLTRNIICTGCQGKGGKSVSKCTDCRGRGARTVIRQVGPGMIQQMQVACDACSGTGEVCPKKDRCKECRGNKTTKAKTTLEVYINKGMKHGERIVFDGHADEAPDTVPGDVVVVLQQTQHPTFRRDGPNLFMAKKVYLQDALLGCEFYIQHLDGRYLKIQNKPGEIIRPGSVKAVKEEGMPQHKHSHNHGNLYIEFEIVFPPNNFLDAKAQQTLKTVLPSSDTMDDAVAPDAEEVDLVDVDMEQERRNFKQESRARDAYGSDDEEEGRGGQRTECRSQ